MVSKRTSRATGPTRSSSTRSAASCAPARATPGWARRRRRAEIEELLGGEQTMIDVVFSASIAEVLDDYVERPAAEGRALRPGRDRRLRRTQGRRHRVDQAHALPGRPRGPGPRLGLRQGRHGDGQLRDRRRRAGGGRGARLRRAGGGDRARARASCSRTARRIRARTVLCNADPKVALALLGRPGRARRLPRAAWRTGRSAARWSSSTPRSTRCPTGPPRRARRWPARATIDVTGGLDDAQRAFEACDARRARRRLRRDLHPDRLRPVARRPTGKHLLSVFGQYAPYELADGDVGQPPRGGRAPVHRPDRPLRARLRATASRPTRCSARPTSSSASA